MCWWSAGPAGLAVAACLKKRGVDVLMVDYGLPMGTPGAALRLPYSHTPRVQSALPGLRMPRRLGRWVAKDDVAAYLADYRQHHGLTPRLETAVLRLEQDGDLKAHRRRAAAGAPGRARHRVQRRSPSSRTGRPDSFGGEVLHASAYANATPYRGKDVLVVGAGNTGAEIAADLRRERRREGVARVPDAAERRPPAARSDPDDAARDLHGFSPAWLADPINRFLQRFVGDLTRTAAGLRAAASSARCGPRASPRRSTSV